MGCSWGLGIAVLRKLFDTKVRSEQDVRALTESPLLGVVAFDQAVPRHPLHHEILAVKLRRRKRSDWLRTNLQFIDLGNRPRSIVVSSSVPAEGKVTVALNLAVSLADTGARIILVDADLRRPSMAEYVGIEGSVGLTTVLIGRADVEGRGSASGNDHPSSIPARPRPDPPESQCHPSAQLRWPAFLIG